MLYLHAYSQFSNKVLEWLPGDTQEMYKQNLVHQRQRLHEHGWTGQQIFYEFNSHGFRCAEFKPDTGILFLGCSFTVGIGLPVEQTWPWLVAQSLQLSYANLGVGGASLDTAFRLCHGYIDQIRPKIVCLLSPSSTRLELFSTIQAPEPIQMGPWHADHPMYRDWVGDDRNQFFQALRNKLGLRYMCQARRIKFFNLDSSAMIADDLARDLLHPGKVSNQNLAAEVLNRLP